jgi:hypothetical protein
MAGSCLQYRPDRQLTIKPRLPEYLLKLPFDSVVSGDQEYGYPLLPELSGGILKAANVH